MKFLVFNVGEFRRKLYGTVNCKHDFFDSKNQNGQKAREYVNLNFAQNPVQGETYSMIICYENSEKFLEHRFVNHKSGRNPMWKILNH